MMVVPAPFYPESGRVHEGQSEYDPKKDCIRFLRESPAIAYNLCIAQACRFGSQPDAILIFLSFQSLEADVEQLACMMLCLS
ncbi:hypothetical protein CIT25_06870 [Mesorhizobium mediterraneum]|uniref:DUF982 domain-containing protein n=1 Tax=Mesorhizobium mediterraneum TaxID=43617 RepID=A0AB36RDY3_9HYPH|nr:hypothetical protein CIT25_06870 [Mesorhizobium mediterraneum]